MSKSELQAAAKQAASEAQMLEKVLPSVAQHISNCTNHARKRQNSWAFGPHSYLCSVSPGVPQEAALKRVAAQKLQEAALQAEDDEESSEYEAAAAEECVSGGYQEDSIGGPDSASSPEDQPTLRDEIDSEMQASASPTRREAISAPVLDLAGSERQATLQAEAKAKHEEGHARAKLQAEKEARRKEELAKIDQERQAEKERQAKVDAELQEKREEEARQARIEAERNAKLEAERQHAELHARQDAERQSRLEGERLLEAKTAQEKEQMGSANKVAHGDDVHHKQVTFCFDIGIQIGSCSHLRDGS